MKKDPVCNMYVDERDAVTAECDGVVYYFCSEGCRDKFLKEKTCKAPRASYDLAGKGGVYCGRAAAEFISDCSSG